MNLDITSLTYLNNLIRKYSFSLRERILSSISKAVFKITKVFFVIKNLIRLIDKTGSIRAAYLDAQLAVESYFDYKEQSERDLIYKSQIGSLFSINTPPNLVEIRKVFKYFRIPLQEQEKFFTILKC